MLYMILGYNSSIFPSWSPGTPRDSKKTRRGQCFLSTPWESGWGNLVIVEATSLGFVPKVVRHWTMGASCWCHMAISSIRSSVLICDHICYMIFTYPPTIILLSTHYPYILFVLNKSIILPRSHDFATSLHLYLSVFTYTILTIFSLLMQFGRHDRTRYIITLNWKQQNYVKYSDIWNKTKFIHPFSYINLVPKINSKPNPNNKTQMVATSFQNTQI